MLKFAQIREDMSLDLEHMKSLITDKTKLVTMVSGIGVVDHLGNDASRTCVCVRLSLCVCVCGWLRFPRQHHQPRYNPLSIRQQLPSSGRNPGLLETVRGVSRGRTIPGFDLCASCSLFAPTLTMPIYCLPGPLPAVC